MSSQYTRWLFSFSGRFQQANGEKHSMKNAITLLQEATNETILEITNSKLMTLEAYEALSAFNGVDDYQKTLLAIVTKYNGKPDPDDHTKTGITVVKLKQVFGDSDVLSSARKKLLEEHKIIETKEGQTVRINLFKSNESA